VVVFEHEPQKTIGLAFGGTGNTRYATNRVKALNAQAHGALAVLVMAEPNRKHPLTSIAICGSAAVRRNAAAAARWWTMRCTFR
jgi:hypothetical protein